MQNDKRELTLQELVSKKEEGTKHGDYLRVLSTGLYISASVVKRMDWLEEGKEVFVEAQTNVFGSLEYIRIRPMNALELKDNMAFKLLRRGPSNAMVVNHTGLVKALMQKFGAGVMAKHPVIIDESKNEIRAKVGKKYE